MGILIQSDEYDCLHLNKCIETFLQNTFRTMVSTMSSNDFNENILGLQQIYEKYQNLPEETSYHWNVIGGTASYYFNKNKDIGDILSTITKEDVLQLYDKYILDTSSSSNNGMMNMHRKKFTVNIIGKNHLYVWDDEMKKKKNKKNQENGNDENSKVVYLFGKDDIFTFKSSMPLCPLPDIVDVD